MDYSDQEIEIEIDSDGIADFGPLMSEEEIAEGEATFSEFGVYRRAVMAAGLTKSRDELIDSWKTDPEVCVDLLDMALQAYEQHELALQFLKVSISRLATAAAKAKIGEHLSAEEEQIVEQAIDLGFSKE